MAAQFKMDAINGEKPATILRFVNDKHEHVCFGAHIKQSFDQRPYLCYIIYQNLILIWLLKVKMAILKGVVGHLRIHSYA